MSKTINLGRVTAYADAVAAGYTGTREEFAQDLANAANYAAESHQSAETASAAAETASTAATTATTAASSASDDASTAHADAEAALSFKTAAETAATTATTKAGEAANSASQAATSASGAAGSATAASGSATAAAGSATNAAASETAAAGSATSAAGSASAAAQTLVDVNAAGATQVAAIAAKGEEVLESIPADYTTLSNDVDDLKSALVNLSDGNVDSMLHAKFYDGYYNGTPEYTGTKTEGKYAGWGVCVVPVPVGEEITLSGFEEVGGTNSCWLNSDDPADIKQTAWQSSANNGKKTCVTGWLGISDRNYLGNTSAIVNFPVIDDIYGRITAEGTLTKYVANKENLTPLYKSDLIYGYFRADNGRFQSTDAGMVNSHMYQFPFDVVIKNVPESVDAYRVVTFSKIVPFSDSMNAFLTSTTYARTVETTIPANTVFCVSVHSNGITADSIDGMFIGWQDFEELKEDVQNVETEMLLKSDTSYVDEQLATKADKTYVDNQIKTRASVLYLNQQISAIDAELAEKADLTDVSSPYNFKGSCTFANLPAIASVNDTWYVTDREYKMTWNGISWYQSSMSEADYSQNLSVIDERLDYKDKQLFSSGAKPSCAVTFTDDDGHEEFYTIIRPICLDKNCKYTSAYVTGSANMTDAQLTQLQADGLFEFISHSHTHLPPDERTDEALRADFAASVEWLKEHNMNYHGYAAPGGNTNARTRRIIKEYFDYNLSGFSGISTSPLYQFDIPRVTLFAPNTTYDLSTYTAWVDKIYANGGWLVFIGHCWEEEFDPVMLGQLIDYIQEKGIEIISTSEGVERYGNLVDLGDHSLQNDELHDFLSVGVDGSVASSGGILIQNDKNVTIDTPIDYFPRDKLTCLTIVNGASAFPEAEGGNLWTMRISQLLKDGNASDIDSFQLWFPYFHQSIYKRRWNTATNAWGEFTKIGPGDIPGSIITNANAFVASSTPADFANSYGTAKVIITPIYSSNTELSSFPTGVQGYLFTYNIRVAGSYGQVRQEYKPQRDYLVFSRWWNSAGNSWTAWKRISGNYALSSSNIASLREADLSIGDCIFNTTLNKPIWRNSSNNGWVDATGTAVSLT